MEMYLFRTRTHPDTTDGVLELDGEKICHTAERTADRLPLGEYEVRLSRTSAKMQRQKKNAAETERSPFLSVSVVCM